MSDFDKEVEQLLRAAMEHPGVSEAVRLIEEQQSAMSAMQRMQDALDPHWVFSVSTTSSPR